MRTTDAGLEPPKLGAKIYLFVNECPPVLCYYDRKLTDDTVSLHSFLSDPMSVTLQKVTGSSNGLLVVTF